MKLKTVFIILLLIIILIGLIVGIVKEESNGKSIENFKTMQQNIDTNSSSETEQKTTIKQNCEVKSALVEKVEPHATYYLEEIYVEENQYVANGANILKYTNGTYLTAPYDCCITELNLPEIGGKLLNSHYIETSSNNALSVTIDIDETNISKISVGHEAKIYITTLEKEFTGYVTNVGSTASNGKFKVTIEFENDGNIKLGMTASVEITI